MVDETRRGILKLFGISAAVAVPITTVTAAAKAAEVVPPALQNPLALALQPPAGMTYNWKRVFVTGDTPDFHNIADMLSAGWSPVPAERHREQLGASAPPGAFWVEFGGLVLMEKSTDLIRQPHPFAIEDAQWEISGEVKGWGGA